jgi:hypothetical protein
MAVANPEAKTARRREDSIFPERSISPERPGGRPDRPAQ